MLFWQKFCWRTVGIHCDAFCMLLSAGRTGEELEPCVSEGPGEVLRTRVPVARFPREAVSAH